MLLREVPGFLNAYRLARLWHPELRAAMVRAAHQPAPRSLRVVDAVILLRLVGEPSTPRRVSNGR